MTGLTPRQMAGVHAIADHLRAHGRAPSLREFARAMGYANEGTAWAALRRIAARGWIHVEPGVDRGIVLLRRPPARAWAAEKRGGETVLVEICAGGVSPLVPPRAAAGSQAQGRGASSQTLARRPRRLPSVAGGGAAGVPCARGAK